MNLARVTVVTFPDELEKRTKVSAEYFLLFLVLRSLRTCYALRKETAVTQANMLCVAIFINET